jgi:TATA-box binding protein (TBP) (component of TFIID and TFIIIB)
MYTEKLSGGGTLVIFKSGKCRLMGLKRPIITLRDIPYKISITCIQSVSVTASIGCSINLINLAKIYEGRCIFEPELFPAVRLTNYNPMCVNVFASGKITVLGLKSLEFHNFMEELISDIHSYNEIAKLYNYC